MVQNGNLSNIVQISVSNNNYLASIMTLNQYPNVCQLKSASWHFNS